MTPETRKVLEELRDILNERYRKAKNYANDTGLPWDAGYARGILVGEEEIDILLGDNAIDRRLEEEDVGH